MKIYTKTGDKGQTSLFGGKRVSKAHNRIEAYGTLDELNSFLGLLADQPVNNLKRRGFLVAIQNHLFVMGSILASSPEKSKVKIPSFDTSQTEVLEKEIDCATAASVGVMISSRMKSSAGPERASPPASVST